MAVIGGVAGLVGLAALLHVLHAGPTLSFLSCAFALAGVAHVIGEATDQLGNHLGPATTGHSPVGGWQPGTPCLLPPAMKARPSTSSALPLVFESQTPRMIAILLLLEAGLQREDADEEFRLFWVLTRAMLMQGQRAEPAEACPRSCLVACHRCRRSNGLRGRRGTGV